LTSGTPFFGDQAWYYFSAAQAIQNHQIPMQGITASITWLHQGVFWTYLIIPLFVFFRFNSLAPVFFNVVISTFSLVLVYYLGLRLNGKRMGFIFFFLWAFNYFAIVNSRIAYHTSPIFYLFIITLLLLIKKQYLLSGLFMGFLYQSHLLTFIYWPLFLLYILKQKPASPVQLLLGFLLGIAPFILSGPLSVGGIFIWIIFKLVSGFQNVGLISESYLIVLFPVLILFASIMISKLPDKIVYPFLGLYIIFNLYYLFNTNYLLTTRRFGSSLSEKTHSLENIPVSEFRFPTDRLPYDYLRMLK
jgi:hypothetical protein